MIIVMYQVSVSTLLVGISVTVHQDSSVLQMVEAARTTDEECVTRWQ